MKDMKVRLSTLWIFLVFNYLYCDVVSNMESGVLKGYLEGSLEGIQITQGFLLGAAVLMEIPILMILLSRILPYRANYWANIIAGAIMAIVQVGSLFVGTSLPTLHYAFYSIIEISCALLIAWFAWKWRKQEGLSKRQNLTNQEKFK